MQNNIFNPFSRGWEIVKALNTGVPTISSVEARKLLAEYARLMQLPASISDSARGLHSAILSVAVKMAQVYPDFHFVPFLSLWGLEHLRPEDSEQQTDKTGKKFPSLVERMAKSYAYSLLFHPGEHLESELEALLVGHIQRKGYIFSSPQSTDIAHTFLATRTFTTEVRGRKMVFVTLLSPDGIEISAEVHTLTTYQKFNYNAIPGTLFSVILRTSDSGSMRIEAAIPSTLQQIDGIFQTGIGYVESIDSSHKHLHIYDSHSRHLVAMQDGFIHDGDRVVSARNIGTGTFLKILPVIPREGKFKSAIIIKQLSFDEGAAAFGYRKARITYVDKQKGWCSWELLPGESPIIEDGTTSPSFTQGYISQHILSDIDINQLSVDTETSLITFLKRGKDGEKHPYVVNCTFSS